MYLSINVLQRSSDGLTEAEMTEYCIVVVALDCCCVSGRGAHV